MWKLEKQNRAQKLKIRKYVESFNQIEWLYVHRKKIYKNIKKKPKFSKFLSENVLISRKKETMRKRQVKAVPKIWTESDCRNVFILFYRQQEGTEKTLSFFGKMFGNSRKRKKKLPEVMTSKNVWKFWTKSVQTWTQIYWYIWI